jgi:hypothetical protein
VDGCKKGQPGRLELDWMKVRRFPYANLFIHVPIIVVGPIKGVPRTRNASLVDRCVPNYRIRSEV